MDLHALASSAKPKLTKDTWAVPSLSLWSPTHNKVHTPYTPHQLGVWWLAGVGGEFAFNRD